MVFLNLFCGPCVFAIIGLIDYDVFLSQRDWGGAEAQRILGVGVWDLCGFVFLGFILVMFFYRRGVGEARRSQRDIAKQAFRRLRELVLLITGVISLFYPGGYLQIQPGQGRGRNNLRDKRLHTEVLRENQRTPCIYPARYSNNHRILEIVWLTHQVLNHFRVYKDH